MEKVELIYKHLENKTPLCFIKLNDGEISGLNPDSTGISRGDEKSSPLMAEKIKNALNFRHPNYYIGLPCKNCNNHHLQTALNNIVIEQNKMTNVLDANILINTNVNKTLEVLKTNMNKRNVIVVTNNGNIKNIHKLGLYNIIPYKTIEVSDKYAFETDYERIKNEWKLFHNNDVVICLCGPLGRILCHEWFSLNSNLTCLELGSLFDPLLKNRSYLYHTGNHQFCENCYPSLEAEECSMMKLCEGSIYKECYYFYDLNNYLNFYGNIWSKIKKNSEIRLEKEPDNEFLKYVLTLSYTRLIDEKVKEYNLFEGHSLQVKEEVTDLINIVKSASQCKNILEIGFHCGHSSMLFLANSNANIVSFDLGEYHYVNECKKIIDETFPNRHTLIIGDSSITLPEFIKSTDIKFDIIFIDGGHKFDFVIKDLYNCEKLSNNKTILIIDDTINDEKNIMHWNLGVNEAWNIMKDNNYIQELYSKDYSQGRGLSYGRYNKPIYETLENIIENVKNKRIKKTVKLNLINHDGNFELNYKNPRENNKPFYIIYHIATVNEKWKNLTKSSYDKVIYSGILEDENCKGLKISYLGEENIISELSDIWKHPKVEIYNFGTNLKLYELSAIKLIQKISREEDCNILYFHCKGLLHENNKIKDWIDFLEYFNIEKYKYCLDKLIDYDTVGCNYYPKSSDTWYVNNPYGYIFYKSHYSGNYWWTKSEYINKLPLLDENRISESRHDCEFWLCDRQDLKPWSFFTSGINFGARWNSNIFTPFKKNDYIDYEKIDFNFAGYKKEEVVTNNKKEEVVTEYKNNSKSQLYNLANTFYVTNNLTELDKVCDLYIEYFNEINSYELRKIKFWSGYANFYGNHPKAIKSLEEIYNDNELDETERFFTMCNLTKLYPRNHEPIPKIIHLLYFGETDFMVFHYQCIKSMIKNMPDYKILMYNNKEPVGNKYWDELKPYFTIKSVIIPETYDGFVLNHFQYKADVVRLELLYEHGGIYLDIDMLIIKNFQNIINSGNDLYISEENVRGGGLINAFIACKPKNEFIKIWLESFKTGLRMENWAYHIREQNKRILDKNKSYILKYNINILESKYFFPFRWEERDKFENIEEYLNEDVYGIHLFETILGDVLINNKFWNNNRNNFSRNNLNPYDEIVVLTLEEYPENHKRIKNEFEKYELQHKLMINKKHVHPLLGCLESHMKAIEYAKEKNLYSIMICEDDVVFRNDIRNIKEYPENWDMLYFGGILTDYKKIMKGWINGVIWCNHAYIVKNCLYDIVLNIYKSLDKNELLANGRGTDWLYTTLINPNYKCWLYENQAIVQKEGYSLINNLYKWNNFDWSTWKLKHVTNNNFFDIIAITVSTNYSDLLVNCLNNRIFYKKWYIITEKNDKATIDLINENNVDNKIEILYYDFKNNNNNFDKGGAILLAQNKINEYYTNETILIIDSDIILPLSFGDAFMNTTIEDDTIYNVNDRINYLTYDDYKNNKIISKISDKIKTNANWKIAGYFQLYKSNKYLYEKSFNCGHCDIKFHKQFANNKILNVDVSHIGIDSDWPIGQNNWDGRILNDTISLTLKEKL